MNLFITGGTGFFGRALLRHLASNSMGYEKVYVLTRNPDSFFEKFSELGESHLFSFLKGDVTDNYESWEGSEGIQPDHIIHAATDSSISHGLDPIYLSRQIIIGTENVLDFAAREGAKRFLYVSSGAVYGNVVKAEPISETVETAQDTVSIRSIYGNAKRLAENMCMAEAQRVGFECVVSRCFSFLGKDMPIVDNFALGSFLKAVKENRDIIINGDGRAVRSYLDQESLAAALLELTASGHTGQIYNVGSDEKISILELAEKIKNLSGSEVGIQLENGPDTGLAPNWYVPNISKLQADLDFDCVCDLDKALLNIIGHEN